jgi:glycerol-3-phosphate O-acyltransferase/dihydroxyacetone phosphate acyltransferase
LFYSLVRAFVGFAIRLMYRLRVRSAGPVPDGPLMFVGNHPNGLMDPALVFVITSRQVTFLAKAPLFRMPLVGWILKGIGGLPVYRKQDAGADMRKNDGTFEAAASALLRGGAITIFPEGRSHSDPALGEMKTGAARIAFRAAKEGAAIKIVPVGLTYGEKNRFRSEVLIEVGEAFEVAPFLPKDEADAPRAVRALTDRIGESLRAVTLNLAAWEDLPAIRTAEAFYAFRQKDAGGDPERIKRIAKGMQILRAEQPERLDRLREEVSALQRRLELVSAQPEDLPVEYRPRRVAWFVLRNLAAVVLGFPLFALGMAVFYLPVLIVRSIVRLSGVELDLVATIKFLVSLVLFPLWVAVGAFFAARYGGALWAIALVVVAIPLGLFTRYFFDRRRTALHDARIFFLLGMRRSLKQRLLAEGDRVAAELEALAEELGPRLGTAETARSG